MLTEPPPEKLLVSRKYVTKVAPARMYDRAQEFRDREFRDMSVWDKVKKSAPEQKLVETPTNKKKTGRPALGEKAMTPAERQRRRRERLRLINHPDDKPCS